MTYLGTTNVAISHRSYSTLRHLTTETILYLLLLISADWPLNVCILTTQLKLTTLVEGAELVMSASVSGVIGMSVAIYVIVLLCICIYAKIGGSQRIACKLEYFTSSACIKITLDQL